MSLPHTFNPVFTVATTPPSTGSEQITIPYAGFSVSSTGNSTEGDVIFSSSGSISFTGLSLDEILPWGSVGGGTNIDSAGWWESKAGTLTASDYDIRFNWSPGSFQTVVTSPFMSQNTWYSLSTNRTVTFGHFEATSFQRINSGSLNVDIRLNATSSIICSKSLSIVTRINEP
jgi:hypothetical protein